MMMMMHFERVVYTVIIKITHHGQEFDFKQDGCVDRGGLEQYVGGLRETVDM